MDAKAKHEDAFAAMDRINRAWLDGRIEGLEEVVHPEIVMVFPGFEGRVQGRERFLSGFHDFCRNAKVHRFQEEDRQADVAGDTAVVTFRYKMIYERSGKRYDSTGRDLWVFQRDAGKWIAVWRTMMELEEHAV